MRGDVDLAAANDCMKKGLEILAEGNVDAMDRPAHQPGHHTSRSNDLFAEFFSTPTITAEDAQKRFAEIIASAD